MKCNVQLNAHAYTKKKKKLNAHALQVRRRATGPRSRADPSHSKIKYITTVIKLMTDSNKLNLKNKHIKLELVRYVPY